MKRTTVLSMVCLFILIVLGLPGCGLFGKKGLTVPQQWVRSDRATYELVAPTLRLLVDGDPSNDPDLTGVNSLALIQLLDAWNVRLMAAEDQLLWLEDSEGVFR